ncbi:hypothetical protein [Actinokineospora sp. NBRC 105648]|uniref:hypothetical protein n=1 Tax=Actinokineospora sp. NBRC 105648 TaxID=3032206 RepID=UPI0024A46900|nr:hypothetical protein [Actinokineospora sp. NBRC 105648]GLZ36798.1 hypothetical protein Acsp05_04230 [Actinokineospora sp. NBRC 105648]
MDQPTTDDWAVARALLPGLVRRAAHRPPAVQVLGETGVSPVDVVEALSDDAVLLAKVRAAHDAVRRNSVKAGAPPVQGLGEHEERLIITAVLPAIRRYARAQRVPLACGTLGATPTAELYADDGDDTSLVETDAVRTLLRILSRSDAGGAVALAGRRGAGKSTLLRALLGGELTVSERPPLTVVASAPARYDARDFILHLYALLCRKVIHEIDDPSGHPDTVVDPYVRTERAQRRRARTRWWALHIGVILTGLAATVLTTALVARTSVPATALDLAKQVWEANRAMSVGAYFAVVFAGLLALEVLGFLWRGGCGLLRAVRRAVPPSLTGADRDLPVLRAYAVDQLDRVRFLQTHTTGWSGKISTPGGGEVGRTKQAQRAEQPLTHPEIVEEFRRFAGRAAAVLRAAGRCDRLVVAIDELDKIGQPEKAHEFVNDIKGIFGVPGCLFVVSVSDEAISSFERRGIAVRDAFDSAFSEMLVLEPFTHAETAQWLERRLPGLSREFVALCHCLSGGVPRELRRCAIEMLDVSADRYQPDIAEVARRLVHADLARKIAAFTDAARATERDSVFLFVKELEEAAAHQDPAAMAEASREVVLRSSGELERVSGQASAFLVLCATTLQVFDTDNAAAVEPGQVAFLAGARRRLGLDWQVASDELWQYRKTLGLPGTG